MVLMTNDTPITLIKDLQGGTRAKVLCVVLNTEIRTTARGGQFFTGTLQDKSGDIKFNIWKMELIHSQEAPLVSGAVIEALVSVKVYRGNLNVEITSYQPIPQQLLAENEELVTHLLRTSHIPHDELDERFNTICNTAHELDDDLPDADTVKEQLDKYGLQQAFFNNPASVKLHHSYQRGLLEHSTEVALLARDMTRTIGGNEAIALFGGLFHDIGKTRSYALNELGVASSLSREGGLVGHLAIGYGIVMEVFKVIPRDKRLLIAHVCLSHHGRYDYGSPILPAFKEAFIIHEADMASSNMPRYREEEVNDSAELFVRDWLSGKYILSDGSNL